MSNTTEVPHHSGLWLLAYLRKHKIDINTINFWPAPEVLLNRYGQSTPVSLLAHMLLDDKEGKLSAHFAKVCPPYKNARKCDDVARLERSFKDFVKKILFQDSPTVPLTTTPKTPVIVDKQVEELQEHHAQIDDWLDKWPEKYDQLLPHITQYIALLDDEYIDPKAETEPWDIDVMIIEDDDEEEYIPNHHLDNLSRILDMFDAKVSIHEKKIRRLRWQKEEQTWHKEILMVIREILISLRTLPWSVLDRYPYGNAIRFHAENTMNCINVVLAENN